MSDTIQKLIQDINSFAANQTLETSQQIEFHYKVLYAIFDNMRSFISSDAINDLLSRDLDEYSTTDLAGWQNIFIYKVLTYSKEIDDIVSKSSHYNFINQRISELSALSEKIKQQFPEKKIRSLELLREQKADYDRLIKIEKELQNLDEISLRQELENLKNGNEEKIKLIESKRLMTEETSAIESRIHEIDVRMVDTAAFINSIESLCSDIKRTSIARDLICKTKFEELEEEKNRLLKIENDLKNHDQILRNGLIGIEITNFYSGEFDKNKIENLSSEISSVLEKLKNLIERKEKIANDLKGGTNGK